METKNAASKPSAPLNKLVIAVAVLAVVIIAAAGAIIYILNNQKDDGMTIGYELDSNVFLEQDSLQAAMDDAMANSGNISLRYQNDAMSADGVNFDCYIANGNGLDMFLAIYADAELTDQLFLSKLLRPGSGFDKLKLDRALDKGDHTVYVALTLVDTEEDGTQVIRGQVVHTMDFHVE